MKSVSSSLLSVGAVLALGLVALTGCTSTDPGDESPGAEERSGGTLTWVLDVAPDNLNPHTNGQSRVQAIFRNVYESLLSRDDDGIYQPGLASDYSVSEDGLTYTFKLREDVSFSNGERLDAAAVALNFEKINDPSYDETSAGTGPLAYLARVNAVDTFTVEITLTKPYSPFLDYAATRYIVAPASFDAEDIHTGGVGVFGTGPFVLSNVIVGQEVSLTRRDDYAWAPAVAAHEGPAYLDEVVFNFYPESSVRLGALTSGQADVISGVDARDVDGLVDGEFSYLTAESTGAPWSLYFNTIQGPTTDVRVREAIVDSVDIDAVIDAVYDGKRTRAWSVLSAANGSAHADLSSDTGLDLESAARLLDAAGWIGRDSDGYRTNAAGERLTLNLYRTAALTADDRDVFLQGIQGQLKQNSGVDLAIHDVDAGEWYERFVGGDFEAFDIGTGGEAGFVLGLIWAPKDAGGVMNTSQVTDPELSGWLDEAAATTDTATQDAAYQALQRFVVQERYYVLPLLESEQQIAAAPSVQGLSFRAGTGDPANAYDVWLDETR